MKVTISEHFIFRNKYHQYRSTDVEVDLTIDQAYQLLERPGVSVMQLGDGILLYIEYHFNDRMNGFLGYTMATTNDGRFDKRYSHCEANFMYGGKIITFERVYIKWKM